MPVDVMQLVQATITIGNLIAKLIQENRPATPEEQENLLAAVKVRQKAEEDDWNSPINRQPPEPPAALSL